MLIPTDFLPLVAVRCRRLIFTRTPGLELENLLITVHQGDHGKQIRDIETQMIISRNIQSVRYMGPYRYEGHNGIGTYHAQIVVN